LALIEEPHSKLHGSAQLILNQLKLENKPEAERIFRENSMAYYDQIHSELKKMNGILAQNEEEARQHADVEQRNGLMLILSSILAALVIGVALAIFITRSITRPVNTITSYMSRVANGDLTVKKIDVSTNDEVGIMANAFNDMIINLKDIIYQIRSTSDSVSITSQQLTENSENVSKSTQQVTGAMQDIAIGVTHQSMAVKDTVETVSQINNAIEQIASGAQEQANNTASTAEMVGQMANSIEEVASSAQTVSLTAEKTKQAADKGKCAVDLTIQGMEGMKDKVFETADKIKELGDTLSKSVK